MEERREQRHSSSVTLNILLFAGTKFEGNCEINTRKIAHFWRLRNLILLKFMKIFNFLNLLNVYFLEFFSPLHLCYDRAINIVKKYKVFLK